MFELPKPLLVGEPEGGSIPADPPATAIDPEPPASDPEPAATPDEGAAPAEDQPPADQETEPTAELTEEDWAALYEKYPDRDPNKVKEQVLAEVKKEPKPERARAQDPFYNAVTQQANDSYARISEASKKLATGELEDANDLLADIAVTGAWQAAAERRGHIAVNRAVVERELGIEALDESDPTHQKYGDLLTSLETAQQNAYRLRQQSVREYDPQKRADILTRAEVMDAHAVGDFYHQTIQLAMEHGKSQGKAEAEQGFSKRAPALADKARTNGHTEAIAKARQMVSAGRAMSSVSEPGKPTTGPLTVEEASTLPIDELIRRSKAQ